MFSRNMLCFTCLLKIQSVHNYTSCMCDHLFATVKLHSELYQTDVICIHCFFLFTRPPNSGYHIPINIFCRVDYFADNIMVWHFYTKSVYTGVLEVLKLYSFTMYCHSLVSVFNLWWFSTNCRSNNYMTLTPLTHLRLSKVICCACMRTQED